jgi:hypothetical protein
LLEGDGTGGSQFATTNAYSISGNIYHFDLSDTVDFPNSVGSVYTAKIAATGNFSFGNGIYYEPFGTYAGEEAYGIAPTSTYDLGFQEGLHETSVVPIPSAVLLLCSGLPGLASGEETEAELVIAMYETMRKGGGASTSLFHLWQSCQKSSKRAERGVKRKE